MRTLSPFALSLVPALAAIGCIAGSENDPEERIGRVTLPIVDGTLDSAHPAVVALLGTRSECSGTTFFVEGSTGYVLTAAHCCAPGEEPVVVVQGADYNSTASVHYRVVDYVTDPLYDRETHDFCLVKFAGASAATPTLPLMTKADDTLEVGSVVDFVGFGVTKGNDVSNTNSKRLRVRGPLSGLDAMTLQYEQRDGGPCSGDSGGPSLSVARGKELVSGVTSYGDEACVKFGVSGRVSAVYDSFILPYIHAGDKRAKDD